MQSRRFSLLSLLVTFVLVISLALPVTAFADDGQPGDPTPEVTEETIEASQTEEDSAPEEEPAAETEEAAIESDARPADEEPAPESVVDEEIAEAVAALVETDSVLVDENGEAISLASEEAAEILAAADPWYVDGGVTHRFLEDCTGQPVDALNTCTESTTPVQAAINAAPAGAEIHVEAGTYEEQLVIDKSVALIGSAGATIQAPSVLTNNADGTKSIIVVTGNGTSASLTGFTIQGPGPTGCGSIHYGIYIRDGAYAYIYDNTIEDVRDNPFSGCQNGVAIQVGKSSAGQTGTADIENNEITGYQKNGITVQGVGSEANIVDNTITGAGPTSTIAQNGIQFSSGATGTIEGNTVTNHHYSPGSVTSTGILLYDAGDGIVISGNMIDSNQTNVYVYLTDDVQLLDNQISNSTMFDNLDVWDSNNVTVSGNTISNGYIDGLWVGEASDITITGNTFTGNGLDNGGVAAGVGLWENDLNTVTISNNDFSGNQVGLRNDDVAEADATYNYWGCWLGAGGAGCDTTSGNVETIPYLTVASGLTDTDSDGIADGSDNCPAIANNDQADNDSDHAGNACDPYPNDPENERPGRPTPPITTTGGGLVIPVTGGGVFFQNENFLLAVNQGDGTSIVVTPFDAAPTEIYGVALENVTAAVQLDIPTAMSGSTVTVSFNTAEEQVVFAILPDGTILELPTVCTALAEGGFSCAASYTPSGSEDSLHPFLYLQGN